MEERYCEYGKQNDLFSELNQVIYDNRQHFASGKKSIHSNFFDTFERISNILEPLQETLEHLESVCSEFDLSEDIKGNGFRSLICITEKCLVKILEIGTYIKKNRDRFFFRSYHFYMEIESFAQVISRLFTVIQLSLSVRTILENGSLFPDEDKYSEDLDGLLDDFETVGRECFYGRSFGFQFSTALQQSLQVVAVAMAAYGDGFKHHNGSTARALSSVLHSGKYVIDPELRAKRIVELTKHVDMPFCKAFWSLTENHGIQHVPMLICPNLAINKEIVIEVQALQIPTSSGVKTINPSFATCKPKKISTRLLSYSHREGQGKAGSTDSLAEALGRRTHGRSKNLVLHCHGGGFVAQSSKSHEIYLRNWAKELDCPILSIDYSLAPDSPYPEALNECFYVYAWTLLNCRSLGTTAERICLTGDSAGGNLMVALTLKAIEAGIRIPDGLSIAYPPMRVQYMVSPSRLLSLMDPLLPPGILKVCLRAYAGDVHAETLPEDTAGSCKSLRTFEHSYNPFDVDLGDGAFWARRTSCVNVTGKRSYSDSNLVMNGQYSTRLQKLDRLRRKDSLSGDASKLPILRDAPEEDDGDGLHMHPIQPAMLNGLMQQTCIREDDDLSGDDANCRASRPESSNCESASKQEIRNSEVTMNENVNRVNGKCEQGEIASKSTDNQCEVTNSADVTSDEFPMQNHRIAGKDAEDLDVRLRRGRSRTFPHHRRSLSDSLAECFYRLRPKSGDFSETLYNDEENMDDFDTKRLYNNETNSPLIEVDSNEDMKKAPCTTSKTEFSAVFIKESDDCLILGSVNKEVSAASSFCDIDLQIDDAEVERKSSTGDSITSSIKRRSRDPFMSPLLASDDMLLKMPQILIVACTLDPLLDDAIEFTRRLKKLDKRAEIFIVDDLPHGFLNFNFASSEAKEASDLLVACIKRILRIGIKHENSFPVSPDALLEDEI